MQHKGQALNRLSLCIYIVFHCYRWSTRVLRYLIAPIRCTVYNRSTQQMIFHHLAERYRTRNLFPFSGGLLIGCKKDPLKCPCISYHRAVKSGERNAENPCISRISRYYTALQTTVPGLLLSGRPEVQFLSGTPT